MADVISPPRATRSPISFGAWLGVVLLFLFFGIFVLVLVAATPHGNNYEEKRAKAREEKLKTIRDGASKDLNSYAWVDKGKGVARIPIDRAMQLTLRDLASKKPEPANPIAAPAAAAAAPAPSPPPPAVSPVPSASGTPKPTSVAGPSSENRGQPAAAANPPSASPGTQPSPAATPAASASPPSGQPAASPSPEQKPTGPPAPGKSPP
jgi:hypothetical protein